MQGSLASARSPRRSRVVTELNEIVEENEEIEPSLVWDINYENHCESCQEDALDRYLEYGTETK